MGSMILQARVRTNRLNTHKVRFMRLSPGNQTLQVFAFKQSRGQCAWKNSDLMEKWFWSRTYSSLTFAITELAYVLPELRSRRRSEKATD
nr:hypothetical protein [Tanacetum cinerariifolium]